MNQKLEILHFSVLPPEIIIYLLERISPEDLCSILLLNRDFYTDYAEIIWGIKRRQHFPAFKTDIIYPSSFQKFLAAHQQEYKDYDKTARKCFSLVKEGDLEELQLTLELAFPSGYKIGALTFINQVLSYADHWKQRSILNFIYEKYLIDEPVVGYLSDGSPYLLEPLKKYSIGSLFEFAIFCQQPRERIVWLIDQGCDVDEKPGQHLFTPLMRAATHGRLDIVKLFIEKGAQVNIQNELGITALVTAVSQRHWDTMHFLIEKGADVNPVCPAPPLMIVIIRKDWDVMRFLVTHGANVHPHGIFNPLITVIIKKNWDAMRFLVKHGAPVDTPNEKGFTPLMMTIFFNHLASVKFLIAKGANIDLVDKKNRTALMHAEEDDLWEIVKYLLEKDAKIDVESDYAKRLLIRAVARGSLQTVKILCQKGVDVNGAALKLTPLVLAVLNGHWEIIQFLVAQGAAIDLPDPDGMTPLIVAVLKNRLNIVNFLIDQNAKIHFTNRDGYTALMYAEAGSYWDIVQTFLERGPQIHPQSRIAKQVLVHAAAAGRLEIVRILIKQDVDVDSIEEGLTALTAATNNNHYEIAYLLVAQGSQIKDDQVRLLLDVAIKANNLRDVVILLDKTTDMKLLQKLLPDAIFSRQVNIAKLILQRGIYLLYRELANKNGKNEFTVLFILLQRSISHISANSLDEIRSSYKTFRIIEKLLRNTITPLKKGMVINPSMMEYRINKFYSQLLNLDAKEKYLIAGVVILAFFSGLLAGFALGLTFTAACDLGVSQIPAIFERFFTTGSLAAAGIGIIAGTATSTCVIGTASAVTAGYLTRYGIFRYDSFRSAAYDAINAVEKTVAQTNQSLTCF